MMSRSKIRQQSLEQPFMRKTPQLQALVRRQKSADDKRSFHSNTPTHLNKSSKSKKGNCWSSEKSKVQIAWNSQDDTNVEVIASKIGTVTNKKTNLLSSIGSSSILESDKATILYSRQELAERLRLAWKQREVNKSNIDIFLAHGTTDDESRCESRLSLNNNNQNNEKDMSLSSFVFSSSSSSSSPTYSSPKSQEDLEKEIDKDIKKPPTDAKSKRASFQSNTNLAFTGLNNTNKISIPSVIKSNEKKFEKQPDKLIHKPFTTPIIDINKTKRTNSAPPLQRPASSVTLGCLPNTSSRTKVNIIIDTPKIVSNKDEKKNLNLTENGNGKNVNSFTPNTFIPSSNNSSTTSIDKPKTFVIKKRTRNGKRRVEEVEKRNESKSNFDVVTMVSLISDADSDSEIEKNSLHDSKLIQQLKNNLPTVSIIKQCSTMANITNVDIVNKPSEDSFTSRRVFKTVSFQQDSIEREDSIRKVENEKKNANYNEGLSKMMMQHQSQLQVIQDGVYEEDPNTWQYDIGSKSSPSPICSNYWKTDEEESSPVVDKEKRCLIVPIDDRMDKKRKLLLQRTKSVPSDVTYMEQSLTMQIEEKDCPISLQRQIDVGPFIHQTEPSTVSIQTSLSKNKNNERINSTKMETLDVDIQSQEPYLKTTKEKECWHLYKKMCDKGVCVSFDTVLRGMLTPTEYRLRRRKLT